MNDVINSQGYTQAAFWNRIPNSAWLLMAAIALCANVLFNYRSRKGPRKLAIVLPFVISIAWLLIADIDAPRHAPQPSQGPRRRPHQRRSRRRRLQLQPAPPLVRGTFTRPAMDTLSPPIATTPCVKRCSETFFTNDCYVRQCEVWTVPC